MGYLVLEQIFQIVHIEKSITEKNLNDKEFLYKIKSLGFTDARISKLSGICEEEILNIRKLYNILPSFKRIDTCAAEFSSQTAYLYSSYENPTFSFCDQIQQTKKKLSF